MHRAGSTRLRLSGTTKLCRGARDHQDRRAFGLVCLCLSCRSEDGWALGWFNTLPTDKPGLYQGISLFDGTKAWFRIDSDSERLIIDYHVGDAGRQLPRISIRIIPESHNGKDADHCIVTMDVWRPVDMTDNRWQRLCAAHDAKIQIIQAQLMGLSDQPQ